MIVVVALLLWSAPAVADDGEPAPDPFAQAPAPDPFFEPAAAPFAAVLEAGKSRYFAGDPTEAERLLGILEFRLAHGEDAPLAEVAEALLYLGEIRYKRLDYEGAASAFEALLDRDPDATPSAYYHPTDVIGFFQKVREGWLARRAPPPPPPRIGPPPPVTWVGIAGVPQLATGRTGAALAFGVPQLVLGAASLGTFVHLRIYNGTLLEPKSWKAADYPTALRRVQIERWAVQVPATVGFYALALAQVLEGRAAWRRAERERLGVAIAPLPDGGGVVAVGGSF